ncbi:MAG: MarR family winged helix-turn-helix transcriptional regulator [Bacillota bacterium]
MEQNGAKNLRELLRILIRNLGVLEKGEASCCGTTTAQCHAIVEIGRSGDISLNELADLLVLDKSTMSRTINNLVVTGQVVRDTHSGDRRYVSIKLTEKGSKAFQNIESSMKQYYENIFRSIPEGKREQVIESLELIVQAARENQCCNQ